MSNKNYCLSSIMCCLSLFCSVGTAFSQVPNTSENNWTCEELKNSYQIILKERSIVNLPIDICDKIESIREDDRRTEIVYSPYLRIIIFSRKEIESNITIKEIDYEN